MTDDELRRVQNGQGRQLLFRARAHRRIRRRRRSSQCLQRLPRRSVADHDGCRTVSKRYSRPDLKVVAARYLDGGLASACRSSAGRKPVTRRRSTARPRSRARVPSRFRPPLPEIITLSCGIPLWVFPRARFADRGRLDRHQGGSQPAAAGPGRARPVDNRHARRGNILALGRSRSRWPSSRWAQPSTQPAVGTVLMFHSDVWRQTFRRSST